MDIIELESRNRLMGLFPEVGKRAGIIYLEMRKLHNVKMRCTHGFRSFEDQNALYNQGRKTSGKIVTYAKGGSSMHQFWCAFDSCFRGFDPYLDYGDKKKNRFLWSEFGRLVRKQGFRWGGDFQDERQDRPHAQMTFGHTLTQLQALYRQGGKDAVFDAFTRALERGNF